MGRIRTIKPDAFTSESLSQAPRGARWTFAGLWTMADDAGRLRDEPRLVWAALYPMDDHTSVEDVVGDLEALAEVGAVCRYQADGKRFMHVPAWGHQRINRPSPSKLPPCPKCSDSVNTHGAFTEDSPREREEEREREVGKGKNVPAKTPVPAPRPEVVELCDLLASLIEGNGAKRPKVTKAWLDSCRLMLDRDGRTVEEVRGAITWSQGHDFWRAVILSMPKVRDKFETMRLQAIRDGQRPARRGDIDWDAAMDRARAMDEGQP